MVVNTNHHHQNFNTMEKQLTIEQQQEIISLKNKCANFHVEMRRKMNDLCNSMDFKKSSHLSHIADRLDLFISDLSKFEPTLSDAETWQIQDIEAGNVIEDFLTHTEAQEKLKEFEEQDKIDGTYSEDFYEIVEMPIGK